jgi:translation elongation factor P/translation initiation factor 5A
MIKIGDKVKYDDRVGEVLGISKADTGKGEVVVSYMIDASEYSEVHVANAKKKKPEHLDPATVNIEAAKVTPA